MNTLEKDIEFEIIFMLFGYDSLVLLMSTTDNVINLILSGKMLLTAWDTISFSF